MEQGFQRESPAVERKWWPVRIDFCRLCFLNWRGLAGWKKTMAATSIVVIGIAILSPLGMFEMRAQTLSTLSNEALSVQARDANERLDRLDRLPDEITSLKVKVDYLEKWQHDTADRMSLVGWAIAGTIAVKFLEVFGVRVVRKK